MHSQYDGVRVFMNCRGQTQTDTICMILEHKIKSKGNHRAQTAGGCLSVDTSVIQKYSVDELISMIKEKLNNSQTYMQQMFRNNDPKGQGTISREAVTRVLWNICGFLTTQQISSLLNRLKLSGHSSISFNDFKNCFQNNKIHNTEWINPSSAKHLQKSIEKQNEAKMTKERSWDLLLETVKKSEPLQKYLPTSCLHSSGLVTFQQFKEAVKLMDLEYTDDEFANMWTRIGKTTNTAVPTSLLFTRLGLKFPGNKCRHILHGQRRERIEKIICAIKEKLNEASISLLQEFNRMSSSGTGLISRSAFRHALLSLNIPMSAVDIEHLLARFNLRRKDGMVDYSTFVDKLRSRSCLSLMQKMMENTEQWPQYDDGGAFKDHSKGLTALEAEWELFQLCQGLFLRLLTHFHKADSMGNGFVNCEDFKEIVEKTLRIPMTEDQVSSFVVVLEAQDFNSLSYIKFLSIIQDRPTTCELKEEISRLSSVIKVHHRMDKIRYWKSCEMDKSRYSNAQTPRTLQELQSVVWNLLQNTFWNFCKVFISICKTEDCTADKEKLDAILLRMNVVFLPEELDNLWHSLPLLYPVEAISLQKLLSHYVSMRKPKDYGPRKENLVETIQTKLAKDIIKSWREIKSIMKNRDPHGTGQVSFTEICAIFLALRLDVGPAEFDTLCQAFDINQDGSFHYIPFLKFYIRKNRSLH
ncbi:EF-hand calcium-binding domain-containing protein 6-like [Discoglossus pictus]